MAFRRDKIDVQLDFSSKECRDKFPVGADPGFSVIKAYDAAFSIPLAGAVFANRKPVSSFHVIEEIFDQVYPKARLRH